MLKNSTHYELDAAQFDQALEILRKEQKANIPTRWQRISYILLSICVYGFVACLFVGIIASFKLRESSYVLVYPFAGLGAILFLMLIILPLNVPLLRKLRHQFRLVRNLGLLQFFKEPWKAERRKRRLRNIMVLLVVLFGLSVTIFHLFGMAIFIVFLAYAEEFDLSEVLVALIIMLFDIIICLAFICFLLMRRYKRRLEVVSQLQSSLTEYKDAAEAAEVDESTRFDIPMEEYEQIAKIERAQILIEREKNILASFEEPEVSYYSVQKSYSLREELDKLNMATRLVVEHQIDDLTSDPKMPGVTLDPETNICRLHIPETDFEIAFTVDHDNRRLKILSLQAVTDDSTSNPKPGG
jgi:mRNA-degrading endonuclease RelE of RelBE toxin-antitoxin system